VLRRADQFAEALGDIEKFCRNFRGLDSVAALSDLIAFISASETNPQSTLGTVSLNTSSWGPEDLLISSDDARDALLASAQSTLGKETADFWLSGPGGTFRPEANDAATYLRALRTARHAPAEALRGLTTIEWRSLPRELQGLVSTLRIALALRDTERNLAISFIAEEAAASPSVRSILPVSLAIADRTWEDLGSIERKLDLAIALDVLWRQTNDDLYGTYLRFSFEDYLFENNYTKPSLIQQVDDVFVSRTIYFLRYVCIPSVMDQAGIVSTSRELTEERIAVCHRLQELDPRNAAVYAEEITEASRRMVIEDGIQIVDSSRVNVDTAALSRWAERRYRESYSRYKALVDSGIGVSETIENVFQKLLKTTDADGTFFHVPDNEADALLVDMVLSLKNEFIRNPDHGLEFYLGKRIRHGTLTGHLRGPVENASLITQRTSEAGPYRRNDFWLDQLQPEGPEAPARLQVAFTSFASSYDDLIHQLTNVQLHVHSKIYPKGIFDITVTDRTYYWIRGLIQTDLNFEDFLGACYTVFWGLLEPSLRAARQLLRSTVKQRVAGGFDELQNLVRANAVHNEAYHSLSTTIRDTAAEVQRQLDTMAEWLRRTEVEQVARFFELREVLDIAVQSALKTHKSFSPILNESVAGDVLTSASVLLVVADVVFIIMDNICRRSKSGSNPVVRLSCAFNDREETLTIEIDNPVGRAVDRSDVERELEKIRERIARGDIQTGASGEGGSGLLKIASMIQRSQRASARFGFIDPGHFRTTVTIPLIIRGKTAELVMEATGDEYTAG
jgi:hypothetical protein